MPGGALKRIRIAMRVDRRCIAEHWLSLLQQVSREGFWRFGLVATDADLSGPEGAMRICNLFLPSVGSEGSPRGPPEIEDLEHAVVFWIRPTEHEEVEYRALASHHPLSLDSCLDIIAQLAATRFGHVRNGVVILVSAEITYDDVFPLLVKCSDADVYRVSLAETRHGVVAARLIPEAR